MSQQMIPGLTLGEARVLVAQLAGMPAEQIHHWVIVTDIALPGQPCQLGLLGSDLHEQNMDPNRPLLMLLEACQTIVSSQESAT